MMFMKLILICAAFCSGAQLDCTDTNTYDDVMKKAGCKACNADYQTAGTEEFCFECGGQCLNGSNDPNSYMTPEFGACHQKCMNEKTGQEVPTDAKSVLMYAFMPGMPGNKFDCSQHTDPNMKQVCDNAKILFYSVFYVNTLIIVLNLAANLTTRVRVSNSIRGLFCEAKDIISSQAREFDDAFSGAVDLCPIPEGKRQEVDSDMAETAVTERMKKVTDFFAGNQVTNLSWLAENDENLLNDLLDMEMPSWVFKILTPFGKLYKMYGVQTFLVIMEFALLFAGGIITFNEVPFAFVTYVLMMRAYESVIYEFKARAEKESKTMETVVSAFKQHRGAEPSSDLERSPRRSGLAEGKHGEIELSEMGSGREERKVEHESDDDIESGVHRVGGDLADGPVVIKPQSSHARDRWARVISAVRQNTIVDANSGELRVAAPRNTPERKKSWRDWLFCPIQESKKPNQFQFWILLVLVGLETNFLRMALNPNGGASSNSSNTTNATSLN
jgi:hypothetical protein